MKFNQFCLLIVAVIFAQTVDAKPKSTTINNKSHCSDRYMRRTDRNVAKLMGLGPHGRLFPENQQQLKAYCRETSQLVEKIEGFMKNCYPKEVQDMANLMIYSVKSNVRLFCRKKTKKLIKLMEQTPCINREIVRDDVCLKKFSNDTLALIPWKGDDQTKMKHVCCNYVASMQCADDYMENVPCIRNNKGLMMDFIRGIFGSVVDVMCGEYNEYTNKCKELSPAPQFKLENRRTYESFIFVLLDLFDTLNTFSIPNA